MQSTLSLQFLPLPITIMLAGRDGGPKPETRDGDWTECRSRWLCCLPAGLLLRLVLLLQDDHGTQGHNVRGLPERRATAHACQSIHLLSQPGWLAQCRDHVTDWDIGLWC